MVYNKPPRVTHSREGMTPDLNYLSVAEFRKNTGVWINDVGRWQW